MNQFFVSPIFLINATVLENRTRRLGGKHVETLKSFIWKAQFLFGMSRWQDIVDVLTPVVMGRIQRALPGAHTAAESFLHRAVGHLDHPGCVFVPL